MKCGEEGCGGELEIIFVIGILVNGRYDQSARHCKNCRRVHWSDCTPVLNKDGKKLFYLPPNALSLIMITKGFIKMVR